MINKLFDQIEKADISALITTEVRENRMLDYKEKLPGSSDSEKTEFLADVSSFANAAGGYILYGIRERRDGDGKPTGIPESVDGLESINSDSEILRLESSMRTGIDPRLPGVRTKAIEGFTKGPVLVMWIPKSWSSPHMIVYKNQSRFYSRSSNGKYPLNVTEIRSAITLSESLPDKIRRLRDNRIARIVAGETPVSLEARPKVVLQVVPISSFSIGSQVSISELYTERSQLRPIYYEQQSHRINFDGIVNFCYDSSPSLCNSYAQVFRAGTIEAVDTNLFVEENGKKPFHPQPSKRI